MLNNITNNIIFNKDTNMKRKLKLLQSSPVENDTCFGAHERLKVSCNKIACRNWIDSKESYNCTLIAARHPMTLNDIGTIFGLTRMRICQIEKIAKQRISTTFKNNSKKIFE